MRYSIGAAIALLALLPRAGGAAFVIDVSARGDAGAGALSILPSSPTGGFLDLSPSAALPTAPSPPAFDPGDSPVVVAAGQHTNASALPSTFSSLRVESGAVLTVDGDIDLPATGRAHDVRIDGTIQFIRDPGTINLAVVSDVIVVGPSARITTDVAHFFELTGEQVFVQGRITGGDSSDVHFIASGPSAVCVFGGLLRFGAESRIDARSDADLFFQAASDLRLGPDGELDAGGARVVLGGRLRGRGKPDVGTGMQLFIRTLQLVGPGPKVKARGGGADVLFGVTDGKHWDSARFVGTIDVRGVDGGSVEFAGQALDVEGKIDARGGETGGTIAFDSSATPVLPPCASLRVSGGLADGSVTQNGAPICP